MRTTQAIIAIFAATAYGRVARRAAFADGDGCIAAQALADGIKSNIDLQTGEQASVEKVKAAVSQNPVDMAAFTAAKSQLLDFVNAGISARENNQAIAPADNAAVAGLGVVSLVSPDRAFFSYRGLICCSSLTGHDFTRSKKPRPRSSTWPSPSSGPPVTSTSSRSSRPTLLVASSRTSRTPLT